MISKLKQKLKDWLLDDPTDMVIRVTVNDFDRTMTAERSVGRFLLCSRENEGAVEHLLVSRAMAADQRKWERIWKRLSGRNDAVWEDGSPANDVFP